MTSEVPALRIRVLNATPVQSERDWVVYWMVAARRTRFNFALQRAVEHAQTMRQTAHRLRGPALRLRVGERSAARVRRPGHGRQCCEPSAARRVLSAVPRAARGRRLGPARGARGARRGRRHRRFSRLFHPANAGRCGGADEDAARGGRFKRAAAAACGRSRVSNRVLVSRVPAEVAAAASRRVSA